MKVTVNGSTSPRKLMAVVVLSEGIYLKSGGSSYYLYKNGHIQEGKMENIEHYLSLPNTTGIYEGDNITLTF